MTPTDPTEPAPSVHGGLIAELTRIMRNADAGIEPTIHAVLSLGLRRLGLSIGILSRVEGDCYTVMQVVQPEGVGLEVGQQFDLGTTYCRDVVSTGRTVREHHVSNSAMQHHPAFKAFGLEAYLGVPVQVGNRAWGTLNFSGPAPREYPFSSQDVEAIELFAAWLGNELGRHELMQAHAKDHRALEATQWLTQSVLDRLPAMVWLKDTQNNILLANRAAAASAGVEPRDMMNQPAARFYPGNAARSLEDDLAVHRSGQPKLGDVQRTVSETGEVSFIQTDKLPVPDPSGEGEGVLVVATDITHLKQTEARAVAIAKRFEAFMYNSPALKWAVDMQGRYVFMNPAYERVMQIDAKTAIGKTPAQVLSQETLHSLLLLSEQANSRAREDQGPISFEAKLRVAGRDVPMLVTNFAFQGQDGGQLVGGSAIDMSELSRIEAELRESEERFRQAFDNAPIGLALVSPQGRWLQVNRALTDLVGYSAEELMRTDFQTITHPEDLDKDLELVGQVLGDQIKSYQMDKRYFHKSGKVVWVRLSVSLVRSPGTGQPLYFISQIEDISQQRAFEQELAQRNDDLKTLLYVISHDLREPMRAVRNFAAIIQEDYAQAMDERGHDMLNRVVRGAIRLDQLLADVLMLSRAQRADLSVLPVRSSDVVKQVLEELQGMIEERGGVIDVDTDLPLIEIDPRWLKRAVYNMVSNALKFSRPGEPPTVRIASYQPPDPSEAKRGVVGLVVGDRGVGVPQELREKVFGLFQRAVGRDVPGTGAGLAIVAQIAKRYGGRAWVRERAGGGSEFVIVFNEKV
ncbi:MAG: PAS domain S-box protein [Planctomycetota bacterium]